MIQLIDSGRLFRRLIADVINQRFFCHEMLVGSYSENFQSICWLVFRWIFACILIKGLIIQEMDRDNWISWFHVDEQTWHLKLHEINFHRKLCVDFLLGNVFQFFIYILRHGRFTPAHASRWRDQPIAHKWWFHSQNQLRSMIQMNSLIRPPLW